MSIEQHQKVFVAQLPAPFIGFIESLTGEKHSQTLKRTIPPFVFTHLIAAGIKPQHIFYICSFDWAALEKTAPAEYRMPLAQINDALNERQQLAVLRLQIPIQPADFVVLAVSIVISH